MSVCSCCNLPSTTSGKGPVVWITSTCCKALAKPVYASAFIYDGISSAKWADGSSAKPFCLPNIQEGVGYSTQFLVGTTPQGCFYKIPVTAVELGVCPPDPLDPPIVVTVLTVPNAP